MFGIMFFALWIGTALDFLGMGTQDTLLSLGVLLKSQLDSLFEHPITTLSIGGVLWSGSLACYAIADTLIGLFSSKDVMTHLNT